MATDTSAHARPRRWAGGRGAGRQLFSSRLRPQGKPETPPSKHRRGRFRDRHGIAASGAGAQSRTPPPRRRDRARTIADVIAAIAAAISARSAIPGRSRCPGHAARRNDAVQSEAAAPENFQPWRAPRPSGTASGLAVKECLADAQCTRVPTPLRQRISLSPVGLRGSPCICRRNAGVPGFSVTQRRDASFRAPPTLRPPLIELDAGRSPPPTVGALLDDFSCAVRECSLWDRAWVAC
jgi:hypothetical protein